ncbi:MAG: LysE family translocator [Euryarchaeota archaeon]
MDALALGLALGVSGGLTPGPLQALLVAETLRGGPRAGLAVAIVPALTDGPLVLAAGLAALQLPGWVLRGLGLAGAIILLYLGLSTLRGSGGAEPARTGSVRSPLRRAIAVNLINPHPYVFWLTVGGPIMGSARTPVELAAFPLGFFLGIVGTQAGLVLVVHRAASISSVRWRTLRRVSGALLLAAGGYLAASSVWLGGATQATIVTDIVTAGRPEGPQYSET